MIQPQKQFQACRKNELFLINENKQLYSKIKQLEKRIAHYQKVEIKMKELQIVNQQNTTRLLQCVSNVRELLHSNKQLRDELQKQKQLKQQFQKKLQQSQKSQSPQLPLKLKSPKLLLTNKIGVESPQVPDHITSLKKHLNSPCRQRIGRTVYGGSGGRRYKSQTYDEQSQSQLLKEKAQERVLTQLGLKYEIPAFIVRRQSLQGQSSKRKGKYEKAMERRKKSIVDSQKRFQILKYKPEDISQR